MSTLHHDSPEGLVANVAQALFSTLFLHPDEPEIALPRRWLAAWLRDLVLALEQLRHPH